MTGRSRKTGALLLITLLSCTVLSGCGKTGADQAALTVSDTVVQESQSPIVESEAMDTCEVSRALEGVVSPYGYQEQSAGYSSLLSTEEEALYQQIEDHVYRIGNEQQDNGYYDLGQITLYGTELPEEQIKVAITAYKNDHPQVFWIANVYGRAYQNGNTIVQLYAYDTAQACSDMVETLADTVKEILTSIGDGQTEFDRELLSFEAVAQRCTYDTKTAQGSQRNWKSYTAYGALVDGTAVCEGYSRAMQLLLSNLHMECQLINGTAEGTNHMWNLVKVGGDWYHLDATWNDQQEVVLYNYFNLTDEAIGADHTVAPALDEMTSSEQIAQLQDGNLYNFSLMPCTATKENYLQKRGILLSSFREAEDRRVIEAFQEAAEARAPAVYFYLPETIDFDMAVHRIFKGRSPKILSYIDSANQLYGIPQIDREQIRYLLSEHLRSITVILTYK